MSVILECNALTKRFGTTTALSDLNLSINRGRIIGLLGPNGSGKTTLIKIVNGLLVPDSGSIQIAGMKPGVESKKIVSYLPEKTYLPDWMRISEAIAFFKDFYEDFEESRAYDMLHRLNLDPTKRLKSLSKGTKEKVQLILVMSRRADLYCLDEPIGGVDPAARDYILNTIITNYDDNASVILSTHLIADIENVLDEVIFIKEGRLVLHAPVDEIREKEGKSIDSLFREVFKC